MPAIVDLIHAQERQALEKARERVELARHALRLEEQRIAAERQALVQHPGRPRCQSPRHRGCRGPAERTVCTTGDGWQQPVGNTRRA
jgi:hypothetical protein